MKPSRFICNDGEDVLFYTNGKDLGIEVLGTWIETDIEHARMIYKYIGEFLKENEEQLNNGSN